MRKSIRQQVEHRNNDQPIAGQVCFLIDKLHRDALARKGVVVQLQLVPVAHPGIARPAGAFQRPLVLPIVNDCRLFFAANRCNFRKHLQLPSHLHRFPEGAGVLPSIVPDDCTMKLFLCAAAGTPLEIEHAVRAVRHGLQGGKLCNTGLFLLGDRLPVGKAGAGLHQQKRLALHGVIQIVHHGRVQRGLFHGLGRLVPCGIVIPAGNVDLFGHLEIVDAVKAVHHVDRELGVWRKFLYGIPFKFQEVNVPVADKSFPVQCKPLHRVFSLRGGAFDLRPVGVIMAPKPGVPCLVDCFQRAVPRLEPAAERGLTQFTMTVAAHFIGDMPEQNSWVIAEPLRQLLVDDAYFFTVKRRGVAIVLAAVVQFPDAVCPDTAYLGVLVRHPCGARCTGGSQNGGNAVVIQVMDDVGQPVQRKHTLLRFQRRPREHPQRHRVDMCLFHQHNILCQNVRPVEPLLRVIVPAVE